MKNFVIYKIKIKSLLSFLGCGKQCWNILKWTYDNKIQIFSIWFIPLIVIVRVIRPFFLIRFTGLLGARVGHFGPQGLLCIHRARQDNALDLFWIQGPVSNNFLEKYFKRHLHISSFFKYLYFCNKLLPGWEKHTTLGFDYIYDYDLYSENNYLGINFTDSDLRMAEVWLLAHGWRRGQKIACIHVRDEVYLDQHLVYNDWRYHNYRNADICTYKKAISWLLNNDFFVVRTGKVSNKRVDIVHGSLVDYPFTNDQDDFIDIWLFSKADLIVTTASGPDTLSIIHNLPILFANILPLYLPSFAIASRAFFFPKHLYWKDDGGHLVFADYLSNSFTRTEEYSSAGIEISDLSGDEILEATIEICESLGITNTLSIRGNEVDQFEYKEVFKDKMAEEPMRYLEPMNPRGLLSSGWIHASNR